MNPDQFKEVLGVLRELREIKILLSAFVETQNKLAKLKIQWIEKRNQSMEKAKEVRESKIPEFTPLIYNFIKENLGCGKKDIHKAFSSKIGTRYIDQILVNLRVDEQIESEGRPKKYRIPFTPEKEILTLEEKEAEEEILRDWSFASE